MIVEMEVIDKVSEILHLLAPIESRQWWRTTDISRELDIHVSTVHRLLSSLKRHGFVAQDPVNKKYSLGLEFLHYAEAVKEFHIVENMLAQPLEAIYKKTSESCFITIREGTWGRIIDKMDSDKPLRAVEEIGTKRSLHIGAANKAILSFLPLKTKNELLKSLKDRESLERELNQIRKKGYAIDENETILGVMVVAIPFFTEKGNVIASLSVAVPKIRMNAETLGVIIKHLIEISEKYKG